MWPTSEVPIISVISIWYEGDPRIVLIYYQGDINFIKKILQRWPQAVLIIRWPQTVSDFRIIKVTFWRWLRRWPWYKVGDPIVTLVTPFCQGRLSQGEYLGVTYGLSSKVNLGYSFDLGGTPLWVGSGNDVILTVLPTFKGDCDL
jgi:hypothetical protein